MDLANSGFKANSCVYEITLSYLEKFIDNEDLIRAYVDSYYPDGYDAFKAA